MNHAVSNDYSSSLSLSTPLRTSRSEHKQTQSRHNRTNSEPLELTASIAGGVTAGSNTFDTSSTAPSAAVASPAAATSAITDSSVEEVDHEHNVLVSNDRRDLLDRGWSTSNLTTTTTQQRQGLVLGHASRSSGRAVRGTISIDVAHFHESWTNSDGADFLGASFAIPATTASPSPPFGSSAHAAALRSRSSGWGLALQPSVSAGLDLGGESSGSWALPAAPEMTRRYSSLSPKASTSLADFNRNGSPSAVPSTPIAGRSVSGFSSVIHDAARITDWNRVLTACQREPQDAAYTGRDGWTALHHACNRRCPYPDVVEALIRAYPEALLKEVDNGWLPLHYACRFKAPRDVIRLLLSCCDEKSRVSVSKRDRQGRTPLYYAVRYDAPPGVVGLLLQVDPSAVLEEDQNEDSPLALVWDSWAEKLEGKKTLLPFLTPTAIQGDTEEEMAASLRSKLKQQTKLHKRWKKVNMLLKAAFGFVVDEEDEMNLDVTKATSPKNRQWRVVHATAAVKCHISLFLLACALYPEQARELDESDLRRPGDSTVRNTKQTALHLAVSSNACGETSKRVIHTLLSLNRQAAHIPDGIDGSLPLHRMVENERKQEWADQILILYHANPRAVRVEDANGKLPLHRAASKLPHLVEEDNAVATQSVILNLVDKYPQAAAHLDRSGCLPLHMIAMYGEFWDDQVEAVYTAHPQAVQVRAGPSWDRRLPIHMAAANLDSGESLLTRLVELHPRGPSMADRQGKLPLHLACDLGKEWDAIKAIYDAFPDALEKAEENARGWLPLHVVAACANASSDLLHKLIELYSEAACVCDRNGRFPLHLACLSAKSWKGGLECLFDANPAAIDTRDKCGLLPLHVAALRMCTLSSDNATESTLAATTSKHAKNEVADLDILFELLRADPTTLTN
jgi:ankyrin repeat protein